MSKQLSTEGRIFAAQVLREVKRREKIGAAAFNAPNWEDGCMSLFQRIDATRNPFTLNALQQTHRRLSEIPPEDAGFVLIDGNDFDLITYHAGILTEEFQSVTVLERLPAG